MREVEELTRLRQQTRAIFEVTFKTENPLFTRPAALRELDRLRKRQIEVMISYQERLTNGH